jgi:hypothetical protein
MMLLSSRGLGVARGILAGVLSVTYGTLAYAQRPAPKGDQKPDAAAAAQQQAQNQEIQTVYHMADAAMAGQTPADFPIQLQTDFLKAQSGRVWMPLTLTLDPTKTTPGPLTLYLRVTSRGMAAPAAAPAPAADPKDSKDKKKNDKDKNAKGPAAAPAAPQYPYEDVALLELKAPAPGQPLRIQRGIGVPPGAYDLYIVMHERTAGGKAAVLKQALDVPNYAGPDLMTSSIILAERVDTLPAPIATDQQSEHPYAFGQTEIVISPEKKFKKSQELIVLFQIYNPNLSADKKFSLEATYTFYRQDAGSEKRFNSTEPQLFTNETMGASFDPTGATSSIQAGQGIPLQSFPEGSYRLEVKITDKQSTKVLTQNVNFTVTP